MGSPLPICGKAASQSSAGLSKESAPSRLATLPNRGRVGKEEIAKKHGESSGLRGEFATLPLCRTTQGRLVWDSSFPEMGAERNRSWQAFAQGEEAILARARMAHKSVSAGPDYPTGLNW